MARLRPHYLRTDWTKILKFDWWVVIDVDYITAKEISILENLVNLFTAQKRLELGGQLPIRLITLLIALILLSHIAYAVSEQLTCLY